MKWNEISPKKTRNIALPYGVEFRFVTIMRLTDGQVESSSVHHVQLINIQLINWLTIYTVSRKKRPKCFCNIFDKTLGDSDECDT